jgi:hypothetical protein
MFYPLIEQSFMSFFFERRCFYQKGVMTVINKYRIMRNGRKTRNGTYVIIINLGFQNHEID